jgi:hypothetical protein
LGNLATPKSVQKRQTALHAKAEAGYRLYVLYDKLSRDDILAHAYAQCCSNKGAPGVDGQDFADIEAYGVERWLGELALALRQETSLSQGVGLKSLRICSFLARRKPMAECRARSRAKFGSRSLPAEARGRRSPWSTPRPATIRRAKARAKSGRALFGTEVVILIDSANAFERRRRAAFRSLAGQRPIATRPAKCCAALRAS